jgi:3-methyl-2-oxobutanoate hydroxymethyltransferase
MSEPTTSDPTASDPTARPTADQPEVTALYGGPATRRIRTRDLQLAKDRGQKWAMLTSYDQYTAGIFDAAGIPVLLVGDSAANNVFGYETTVPITADELIPLVRAVVRATTHSLVIGDLPFGSYEEGPKQALRTAVRFMKEGGCHGVKLEGGQRCAKQIEAITKAGIPVMAHIGFTPQSEHALGGYRVQGRGDAAEDVHADAHAVAEAGAFAVVLEMVPGGIAKRITHDLTIPTIGIGAGPDTDAQVLVWQDMAGLRAAKAPRFVKRYADLAGILGGATRRYADEVRSGAFPAAEHTFE